MGLYYHINIVLEHLSDLGKVSYKIEEEGRDYWRHCDPFLSLSVSSAPHSLLSESLRLFSPHTVLFVTNSFISWQPPYRDRTFQKRMWVLWKFPKVYSLWHCSLGIPEDVGTLEISPSLILVTLCSLYSRECGCYGKTSLSTPRDTVLSVYQKMWVLWKNFKGILLAAPCYSYEWMES